MGRGMSMEEFRDALSSEASIENEKLKKELEDLKKESSDKINELQEELDQYKDYCNSLCNRCFVLTEGVLCISCNISACTHAYDFEDLDAAVNFMKKHNMQRNQETYDKVNEFLQKRKRNK